MQKLSEAEAAAHQQQLLHTAGGASAWNAAGTWEERPVALAWVQQQLGELLAALHHSARGVAVAVAEVTSCRWVSSGGAGLAVVRGRAVDNKGCASFAAPVPAATPAATGVLPVLPPRCPAASPHLLPPLLSRSGEAHQWVVRGKRRAGFELAVEFKWRAELGGGAAVTGTAK